MTKGEIRKTRKAARERGESWSAGRSESGSLEVVRERTSQQERKHERSMERWARRMDADPDWR
jgi:hypothetical protein